MPAQQRLDNDKEYDPVDAVRRAYTFDRSLHSSHPERAAAPSSRESFDLRPATFDPPSPPRAASRPPSPLLDQGPSASHYNTRHAGRATQVQEHTTTTNFGDDEHYDEFDEYDGSSDDYEKSEKAKEKERKGRKHRKDGRTTEDEDEELDRELENDVVPDEAVVTRKRKHQPSEQVPRKRSKKASTTLSPVPEEPEAEEDTPIKDNMEFFRDLVRVLADGDLEDLFPEESPNEDGEPAQVTWQMAEKLLGNVGTALSEFVREVAVRFDKDYDDCVHATGFVPKEGRGPNSYIQYKQWYAKDHPKPADSKSPQLHTRHRSLTNHIQ